MRVLALALALALASACAPTSAAGGPPAVPFAPDSAWNTRIPDGARFEEVPGIADVPVGMSNWLRPDGVSVPLYAAGPGDPEVAVLYVRDPWPPLRKGLWRTSGNPPDVEADIRAAARPGFPFAFHPYASQSARGLVLPAVFDHRVNPPSLPLRVRIPAGARPAGSEDGHLVVFQPDGKAFESYGTIVLSDGTVTCQTYMLTDPSGAGDGRQNGVTASLIPVYAGLVRPGELSSGRIPHAIKILTPARLMATAFVPPALAIDRGAITQDPPYSGSLPMGARLGLPPGADDAALGIVTPLGRAVAEAARSYGMIVTDQGGGGITVVAERGAPDSAGWSKDAQKDLRLIAAALRRVRMPGEPERP